jgi:hypothetical protein
VPRERLERELLEVGARERRRLASIFTMGCAST